MQSGHAVRASGPGKHHPLVYRSALCVVDPAGFLIGTLTHQHLLRLFLRSDAALLADIEDRLTRTIPAVRHSVTVQVRNGTVTLDGTVLLSSMVKYVVNADRHVPGVIDVHNNLEFAVNDQMITGL